MRNSEKARLRALREPARRHEELPLTQITRLSHRPGSNERIPRKSRRADISHPEWYEFDTITRNRVSGCWLYLQGTKNGEPRTLKYRLNFVDVVEDILETTTLEHRDTVGLQPRGSAIPRPERRVMNKEEQRAFSIRTRREL